MSSKEILDALLEVDPNFHKEIKSKCEDYSRIVLSQAKNIFNKFKRKEPEPGIDRRTLFYGLVNDVYDFTQWVPVGKVDQSNLFSLTMEIPNSELKPSSDDVDSSSALSGIVLNALPNFSLTDSEFYEAKEAWKVLIDSVDQSDVNFWKIILEDINKITLEILSGRDPPDIKALVSEANVLPTYTSLIEKLLQSEVDMRLKLLGK